MLDLYCRIGAELRSPALLAGCVCVCAVLALCSFSFSLDPLVSFCFFDPFKSFDALFIDPVIFSPLGFYEFLHG